MPSKTKKVKDTVSKNKTLKKKKVKTHDETVLKVDGRVVYGTDGKKLRIIQKYKDSSAPITRKLNKGKDYWRPESIKLFNYLINKYKKRKTNYILDDQDKEEIKKFKNDETIPTHTKKKEPVTETKKESVTETKKESVTETKKEPEPQIEENTKIIKRDISSDEDLDDLIEIPEEPEKLETNKSCVELLEKDKEDLKRKTIRNAHYQKISKCIEEKNRQNFIEQKEDSNLYPNIMDPNFTTKLTHKKEFLDTKMYSKKHLVETLEEEAEKLCNPHFEFELEPHQMFIKNFMSFQTPYNSLLVFHGLGTGKTCSAIGVAEEMRSYYKQLGINKKILIVATPNVQKNFELQLFDKTRLKNINGLWNIKACSGSKFIKEINPMNIKNLPEEKVVKYIKKIIKKSYEFIGYIEFANQINNLVENKAKKSRKIKEKFSDRLIIIDEVHNIRTQDNSSGDTDNVKSRRTIKNFLDLVTHADNMKLLLLTATPMFNNAKEIIWLTNLMNLNDKRFPIKIKDVFDDKGDFVEGGKQLLINKLIGYVSYLSGENPFTFPYRIFPKYANSPNSLLKLLENDSWNYPSKQMNEKTITPDIQMKYLDLFMTSLSNEQEQIYNYAIRTYKNKRNSRLNEGRDGIPMKYIEGPLQILNISYPHEKISDNPDLTEDIVKYCYGKPGLTRVMEGSSKKKNFRYTKSVLDKFGRIFSAEEGDSSPLKKYSSKIYSIIKKVKESDGVVIIYSNYIDGGCVPMALALEEAGITRYGNTKSLFKDPPVSNFKINGENAKYIMITGDKDLSPKTEVELAAATSPLNKNGERVKVVIISRAGSEGLDFKNIRQIHILEPWYNLNRIDQILGRGVRNKSHCALPFTKRTVEIFLYGTKLTDPTIECIDLYVYRTAEQKSVKIGKITRLLKENSIDCILNKTQQEFNASVMNKTVELTLSNNDKINFNVGHKNNSLICDFMNCEYTCTPNNTDIDEIQVNNITYNKNFIIMNLEKILQRIRNLFKEHYIYDKETLIKSIEVTGKRYSIEQIDVALDTLINDKSETLVDMLGNVGHLINIGNFYAFQPDNIEDIHISTLQRKRPVDVKNKTVKIDLSKIKMKVGNTKIRTIENTELLNNLYENYQGLSNPQKTPKKSWIKNAAWVINNLSNNHYNGIDKATLMNYALLHLFEILQVEDKIKLLNSLYGETDLDDTFIEIVKKILLDTFIVEEGDNKAFVMADFQKKINKIGYIFLLFNEEENKWIIENNFKNALLKPIVIKVITQIKLVEGKNDGSGRSYPKKGKINNFNTEIGFITKTTGNKIGLKTKQIGTTGRVNKGIVCPSAGVTKSSVIYSLNQLNKLVTTDKGVKYNVTTSGNKITINSIYSDHSPFSRKNINYEKVKKNARKPIVITDTQFCIEKEFLLRYLDENDDDKKWFFNSFESQLNTISNLKVDL